MMMEKRPRAYGSSDNCQKIMSMKLNHQLIASSLLAPAFLFLGGCKQPESSVNWGAQQPTTNVLYTNLPSAINADNTGNNAADRNTTNLTSLDQGNSPADRATSASIRKLVVSGTNNFSVTARNIKIITVDGKVTLRGPVNTDAEKTGVVALAKQVAGDGNVDDQLMVKNTQ
jgi:hyperosmotically inducible protein